MMAAPKKTYFLSPNWDVPPLGAITLGNIITSPRDPSSTLLSPTPSTPPNILASQKTDLALLRGSSTTVSLGVWASFLSVLGLGADAGVSWGKELGTTYTVDRMDTNFFELSSDPESEAYLQSRIQDPRVQLVLKSGSKRKGKSVFIITGVKIARGFALSTEIVKSRGIRGKLGLGGAAVGVPVEGGPEAELSWENRSGDGFGGSTDIVFAYRVREIWRRGEVIGHKEFNKSAFMNKDDKAKGEEKETDLIIDVGEEDVNVTDLDDGQDLKAIEVYEDDEDCVCIFP